jgi:A/G-specific adenine glycosylase
MPTANFATIRRKLLRWYDKNKRDLPWRRTSDPYAIWIAETMLQQTQVATVSTYYNRFLRNFSSVESLARAPLHKVLALWSGLGYYKRAENLKKAARQIVREHGGAIPANYDELRSLPGIGDYTAGALLSIAFHKPYPAIDGNARRVLGRLLGLKDEPSLHRAARQLVPRSEPGYFNQGLMELGATICAPAQPRCPRCPIATYCAERGSRGIGGNPTRRTKPIVKDVVWPVAIIRCNGKILLHRRSAEGQLANLWELPGGEKSPRMSLQAALKEHLGDLGVSSNRAPRPIGEIRHSITNRRIRAPVFLLDLPISSIPLQNPHWRWIHASVLRRYPVVAMTLKATDLLAAYEKNSL